MSKQILEKDQFFGVRISMEEKMLLNELAEEALTTPSETVRRLIREETERKKQRKKKKNG